MGIQDQWAYLTPGNDTGYSRFIVQALHGYQPFGNSVYRQTTWSYFGSGGRKQTLEDKFTSQNEPHKRSNPPKKSVEWSNTTTRKDTYQLEMAGLKKLKKYKKFSKQD